MSLGEMDETNIGINTLNPQEFSELLNSFGIDTPDKVSRLVNDEFNY